MPMPTALRYMSEFQCLGGSCEDTCCGHWRIDIDEPHYRKLEGVLVEYGVPLAEMVPLYASLLSLPLGDTYAPSLLTPRQQRERLLEALALPLLYRAGRQPVLFVVEKGMRCITLLFIIPVFPLGGVQEIARCPNCGVRAWGVRT